MDLHIPCCPMHYQHLALTVVRQTTFLRFRPLQRDVSILESLLPKSPRSKLELHRELIRELRHKGRTYREVAQLFHERLGLYVAPSTLHSFVSALQTANADMNAQLLTKRNLALYSWLWENR